MMVDHTQMRIQLPQQLWQLLHCLLHHHAINPAVRYAVVDWNWLLYQG